MSKLYVQYGCGLSAPQGWQNFDASPTLRLQKIPMVGASLAKGIQGFLFPPNVKYGDITSGLIAPKNSCDGIYCSHVLEHLSYEDFQVAIKHSYQMLKPGGIFRLVMPDLENMARSYISNLESEHREASTKFIQNTLMGKVNRERGMKSLLKSFFGNSHHLWLWDHSSAIAELEKVGFSQIRRCCFNDSKDEMFKLVEDGRRFQGAVAIEVVK